MLKLSSSADFTDASRYNHLSLLWSWTFSSRWGLSCWRDSQDVDVMWLKRDRLISLLRSVIFLLKWTSANRSDPLDRHLQTSCRLKERAMPPDYMKQIKCNNNVKFWLIRMYRFESQKILFFLWSSICRSVILMSSTDCVLVSKSVATVCNYFLIQHHQMIYILINIMKMISFILLINIQIVVLISAILW